MDDHSIARYLMPELTKRFGHHGLRVGRPPQPIAVFPPKCPPVGKLSICDDGDELSVFIENVTHHHVCPTDEGLSGDEGARYAAESVLGFVEALFDDRVVMWSKDGGKSGGWEYPYSGEIPKSVPKGADVFLWSRQIRHSKSRLERWLAKLRS